MVKKKRLSKKTVMAKAGRPISGCDCTACLQSRFGGQNSKPSLAEIKRAIELIGGQFTSTTDDHPLLQPVSCSLGDSTWAQDMGKWIKLLVPHAKVEATADPEKLKVSFRHLRYTIDNMHDDEHDVAILQSLLEASEGRYTHVGAEPKPPLDKVAVCIKADAAIAAFESWGK